MWDRQECQDRKTGRQTGVSGQEDRQVCQDTVSDKNIHEYLELTNC